MTIEEPQVASAETTEARAYIMNIIAIVIRHYDHVCVRKRSQEVVSGSEFGRQYGFRGKRKVLQNELLVVGKSGSLPSSFLGSGKDWKEDRGKD